MMNSDRHLVIVIKTFGVEAMCNLSCGSHKFYEKLDVYATVKVKTMYSIPQTQNFIQFIKIATNNSNIELKLTLLGHFTQQTYDIIS